MRCLWGRGVLRTALLAVVAVPARGQFQLYLVNGALEQPVASTYDFGAVEPGLPVSAQFRIRNITDSAAFLDVLAVNGTGFSLAAGPAMPATIGPRNAVDFKVVFLPAGTGNYNASLDSVGIAVLLTGTAPVELTCLLGSLPLGAAPVDFGTVALGSAVTRHVILVNQTDLPLIVPAISVTGAGFALSGPTPSGVQLKPVVNGGFDVEFNPAAVGVAVGALEIGARSYILSGAGIAPVLPAPRLSLTLAQPQSAQQGSIAVNFDAASLAGGGGTVTLTFQPAVAGAADPAIAWASGGQTAAFTFSAGDTQGRFGAQTVALFQTGTTAGTLTILAQLGGLTDQQTVVIAPSVVGIATAQGLRSGGGVEVDLTGFDNTRTAGMVTFTFYDAAGNSIAPGAIQVDGTAAFAAYFQGSAGGTFALNAVFPVSGDASRIQAFEASLTNSVGAAKTGRVAF